MNEKSYVENGAVFESGDNRLVGVLTRPLQPAGTGVVILVGGPQYRVGSHRQFALLARELGAAGIAVLRFDYTGMGDSEGEPQGFSEVSGDIDAAIRYLQQEVPEVHHVALWGLCDAASTAMLYAASDARVNALVLLNPWVHSGQYSPEVKFSHYYGPLLRGGETWRRLLATPRSMLPALGEFISDMASLLKRRMALLMGFEQRVPLVDEMLTGFRQFKGKSLILISQLDLTAREFMELTEADRRWRAAVNSPGVSIQQIDGADHTFSNRACQDEVTRLTLEWVSPAQ